jgi:hypothetical protein
MCFTFYTYSVTAFPHVKVTGFTGLLQRLNQTKKLSLLLSQLRNAALQTMDFSLQGLHFVYQI